MGYKKYIASKEWKQKKRFAIQLAEYKCEDCDEKGYLEVHHANYDCLYHERFDDVWVLCKECHRTADEHRVYWDSYRTYMRKKYGRNWQGYDSPATKREFSNWLEDKEYYDDGWPSEDNYYGDDYW